MYICSCIEYVFRLFKLNKIFKLVFYIFGMFYENVRRTNYFSSGFYYEQTKIEFNMVDVIFLLFCSHVNLLKYKFLKEVHYCSPPLLNVRRGGLLSLLSVTGYFPIRIYFSVLCLHSLRESLNTVSHSHVVSLDNGSLLKSPTYVTWQNYLN